MIKIKVVKDTGVERLQRACEMTFIGKSKLSLERAYRCEHSIICTQHFWVEFHNIPLFVATQFIRHSIGNVFFQTTCREDRKGANPKLDEKLKELAEIASNGGNTESYIIYILSTSDRFTRVNLGMDTNAMALINIAKKRLCGQASKETRFIFNALKKEIAKVDKDLTKFLVPNCIYRGGICPELKPCGYNKTRRFQLELDEYKALFVK